MPKQSKKGLLYLALALLLLMPLLKLWKKMKSLRSNNPFNIRFNKSFNWDGQVHGINWKGFCLFGSYHYGLRAGMKLLSNYRKLYNLKTPRAIIERFAPHSENPTNNYIDYVSKRIGIPENTNIPFSEAYWVELSKAMIRFETGKETTATDEELKEAFRAI